MSREAANNGRIQILDGAMGTNLENLGYDITGPMWGADLLVTDPKAVREVHDAFVDAGADIIETGTYQMTQGKLVQHHNLALPAAGQVMRNAISLAFSASQRLSRSTKPQVALSLGPFGATLSPGQEYSGVYPPPYGPHQPSASTSTLGGSSGVPLNDFPATPAGGALAVEAEEALMQWHLHRLRVYAEDEEAWRKVDWLAFETVPLLREVRAIRRAVGGLYAELEHRYEATLVPDSKVREAPAGEDKARGWYRKKFWIVSAYPRGQHPQLDADGGHASPPTVLASLLSPLPSLSPDQAPRPDGVGINCTHPNYIARLTAELTAATRDMLRTGSLEAAPVFVLYPDGGAVYDTFSKTWSGDSSDAAEWAQAISRVTKTLEAAVWDGEKKVWSGVVVGGCCKTSFDEIRQLRVALASTRNEHLERACVEG